VWLSEWWEINGIAKLGAAVPEGVERRDGIGRIGFAGRVCGVVYAVLRSADAISSRVIYTSDCSVPCQRPKDHWVLL
jgi:hypothetical protein